MIKPRSTTIARPHKAVPTENESQVRFAELLKLRSLAEGTQRMYLSFMRKLGAYFGIDPATLREEQAREYLLYLKDKLGYSPSSMRVGAAAMRAFYGLLLGHDWRLFDVVRCSDASKLPIVLTREQVARLLAAIREPRFYMILSLIYACGLRISEALTLEVSDIHSHGRARLHLRSAKGRKDRYVPLPDWVLKQLRVWWRTHRHRKWIFPGEGPNGKVSATAAVPMSPAALRECFNAVVAQLGLPPGTHVHTLRHCYATHLLEEGVDIRLISAYLGHASLETTMVYVHLTAVNEVKTHEALARLQPSSCAAR
jgi:site-specific recombinase XerD